jgi:hypothetical protein
MLRRILQLLEQGGVHTVADLAAVLDTSEALAEQMIESLAQRGYLIPLVDCSATCATCHARGLCQSPVSTQPRVLAFRPQRAKT